MVFFFYHFPPCYSNAFLWNITNLAFSSFYVVTGYLCPYSLVSDLTDWIEQSPKSLSLISWNFSFIARFAILFCHPFALQMVRYCGFETLRKGQTSLFWQEGMLTLIVRRFRVGTSFLRTVLSQWMFMWHETFCFLVPFRISVICIMNILISYLLYVPVQCFKVYEAPLTFPLIPMAARWGTITFCMTFVKLIKVKWLTQGLTGAWEAEPGLEPRSVGYQSWLSLSFIHTVGFPKRWTKILFFKEEFDISKRCIEVTILEKIQNIMTIPWINFKTNYYIYFKLHIMVGCTF